MTHRCHWPDCPIEVPPAMWGCKPHWFTLPKEIRARIWANYVPGQEITKTPSPQYIKAAMEAQRWISARKQPAYLVSEGSSKGKTAGFEPANAGSNPAPSSKETA